MKNTANTETPNAETSVLLRIEGVQTDTDGNTQRSAQEYPARYMARGDSHLLRYMADREEAVLCLSRGKARMQRGGSGGTDMVFDPLAPSTDCAYRTPFGTIPMKVRTRKIVLMGENKRGEEDRTPGLRCRISYRLIMDGGYEMDCSVTIRLFPQKEGTREKETKAPFPGPDGQ